MAFRQCHFDSTQVLDPLLPAAQLNCISETGAMPSMYGRLGREFRVQQVTALHQPLNSSSAAVQSTAHRLATTSSEVDWFSVHGADLSAASARPPGVGVGPMRHL